MSRSVTLPMKDYMIWSLIVVAVFLIWMWLGDWGRPPYPTASPISYHVFSLYTIVYVGAGVVTALFMGTMIFFVYKFRERESYGEG